MRKYCEVKGKENTTYQNYGIKIQVFNGKCIVVNTYIRKDLKSMTEGSS